MLFSVFCHRDLCAIRSELDYVGVHVFGAMIGRSASKVRRPIRYRHEALHEDDAVIRPGFDWGESLASAIVSEATAHLLMLVADDPTNSLVDGLGFHVEQRFAT